MHQVLFMIQKNVVQDADKNIIIVQKYLIKMVFPNN
jgi:hypothetical protein